ncbi:MAG: glycosyltransferase [Leptolyngbyaceae cyanobacterium bins.59]|nr:glycosyltransferase [Leptolyngbyaceae cyanobacterium bins.59]
MPTVSIIVPVFNGEKYLKSTIESVLIQTFSDFEIIVINDGSTDRSLEVLSTIKDSRIQIFTYENAGVSVSRNRGIAIASGEYISFLDADDLWTSNKLENQLAALKNNPDAAVVYSWTDYIDQDEKFLYPGSHCSKTGNIHQDLLVQNFIENGSNILLKKQTLLSVGDFDPALVPAEDWDLCLRLAAHHLFTVVPQPQILYRISPSSASANVMRQEVSTLKVLEKHCSLYQIPSDVRIKSLANLYRYLTFRCLETASNRQGHWLALYYFNKWLSYDPKSLIRHTKLISITIFKIIFSVILSPTVYRKLHSISL